MTDVVPLSRSMDVGFGSHGNRASVIRLGLVYWAAVFVLSSIIWGIVGTDPLSSAPGKVVHYAMCALLAAGMSVVLFRIHEGLVKETLTERSLPLLALAAFASSLVAAPLWAASGHLVHILFVWPQPVPFDLKDFGYDMAYGGGLLFGWACLFIALVFAFELNERTRRLAAAREEALEAQMRALRYQINPHFLFNTLNAVAGLIEEGDAARAERMVLSLSTFLRTTLSLDPFHDVTLADEVRLQEEYLGIERERFSDRMTFTLDCDRNAGEALVPSLILQPLIENAVKHGAGTLRGRVRIALQARRIDGRLTIAIENDMPPEDGTQRRPPGVGVGLHNVAERLRLRFRDDAGLTAEAIPGGRFRTTLDLPWRTA